ncbi:sugar dehydratase [Bacillus nakamurai]|uniref:sugar dehydratase n=1 Tax=Bacillus nakamurai TaxID=1793963 RepID=UPI001E3A32B7|nr:sugar dehydratase [Bacillus nakamurai]MCC9021064.1 sugar dehydratase [Bacillus nakamurai]
MLRQLPAVRDHRSPDAVYRNIQMVKYKKKPVRTWIGPAAAAACALCIAFIISPHLLTKNESGSQLAADEQQTVKTSQAEPGKPDQKTFVVSKKEKNNYITMAFADSKTSAVIPVSFEKNKPNESIEEALTEGRNVNVPDSFMSVPELLDGVKVTEDQKDLLVQINQRAAIESSAEADLLQKMLKETLSWSPYERIKVTNIQSSTGLEFGKSYGISTEIPIPKKKNRAYFSYHDDLGQEYLIPSEQTYDSIKKAIDGMKTGRGSHTAGVIEADSIASVSEGESHQQLRIQFSGKQTAEDSLKGILMIEGLLLTAKEFGFSEVLFTHTRAKKIGEYDVTKPISVPAAPNPIPVQ